MANGDEIAIETTDSFNDPDYYTDQNTNAIKVSFSSLMVNHLDFYYEKSITPSSSYEVGLGITGIGFNPDANTIYNTKPFGISLRGGYKFKRSPDFYLKKMRYGHILKGGYLKPELIVSIYAENDTYYSYDHITGEQSYIESRATELAGALMLNFGKQQVFSNRFSIDYSFGIGYGFTSGYGGSQYAFLVGEDIPIAFQTGITLGYLFGNKKK